MNDTARRWTDLDRHPSGLALLGAVLAAMMALTWKTWPDPIIDFGRELYVPWRLTEGQHLYSQIAYHNGPLSPYLNATWFSWYGVSLAALFTLNALVVAGVVALLRALLREITGPGGATVGAVSFLVLFAFAQFVNTSNYNWMSPYSHELTHGLALALLALWLLRDLNSTSARWKATAAGAALGLCFLTKAEVFAAAAVATTAALGTALWVARANRRRTLITLAWAASGLAAPPLVALLLLSRVMPFDTALHGTMGTWAYVFDPTLGDQQFVRHVSGLDHPSQSLVELARSAGLWLVGLAPIAIAARVCPPRSARAASLLLAAGYLGFFYWIGLSFPVQLWLKPLSLVLLGWTAWTAVQSWRARDAAAAKRLSFLALSTVLLLKVVLNVRVGHYGFGLAMPGTVLLLATVCGSLPVAAARLGLSVTVTRPSLHALWLGLLGCHLAITLTLARNKTTEVGTGADAFWANSRGQYMVSALQWLERVPPSATMTVMIDCEMLNYLSRHRNPVRYGNFNPQQVHLFGENAMVAELAADMPDWVALVHSDTSEYGPQYFGRDYGRALFDWVQQHYQLEPPMVGAPPFRDRNFGIAFLRRRP